MKQTDSMVFRCVQFIYSFYQEAINTKLLIASLFNQQVQLANYYISVLLNYYISIEFEVVLYMRS